MYVGLRSFLQNIKEGGDVERDMCCEEVEGSETSGEL